MFWYPVWMYQVADNTFSIWSSFCYIKNVNSHVSYYLRGNSRWWKYSYKNMQTLSDAKYILGSDQDTSESELSFVPSSTLNGPKEGFSSLVETSTWETEKVSCLFQGPEIRFKDGFSIFLMNRLIKANLKTGADLLQPFLKQLKSELNHFVQTPGV